VILTIIPARSGSKGLKNKNIQKISNKTLIDHRIDMVKKAKLTNNQIILSTDSKKYKKLYEKKILVPFLRPKNLALDKSETFPLLLHAINFFKKKNNSLNI
jgi:CMP-N,N'-diacetyllegionaminic acid synthase